ncbi:hypothetical protein Asulf_01214 [Archaeoglobus sulfaticallidus PM70-1]|uniref:Asparagine synthetase domain-containing protein n=1 Tax=Archaeoglobus sulfaticallidus PM70-1 TaxID=387631 RepID=N0BFY4_9EURY|nr:asparagine synthetase B [Archaeoglobus sulfaticallidus]AGK61212.1 hypothetical protein Asulf_01214 [Archaeoglobus sulfaticallidus PM70-1]
MSIFAFAEVEEGRAKGIFAGARYPSKQEGNILYDCDNRVDLKYADELPLKLNKFYSVVAFRPSHIYLSRDVLGGKPLYYSQSLSFSSFEYYFEDNFQEVKPGEVVKLDYEGNVIERKRYTFEDVFDVHEVDTDVDQVKERIAKLLEGYDATGCIAFSGGLDSSLLASIYDLSLVSVTASDEEEKWLRKSAKMIGRDIEIRRFDLDDLVEVTRKVSRAIESTNPVQVSIGIPIYLTMEFAKSLGYDSIVFGQGADELFGGYMKYLKAGHDEMKEEMLKDVREIGKNNLVRDAKISYKNEIKLQTPYLQWDLIKLALSIPAELKVRDGIRKYILREVALDFLPEEIAKREKKAIQYSTKASAMLKKLARKKNMNVKEFIEMLNS